MKIRSLILASMISIAFTTTGALAGGDKTGIHITPTGDFKMTNGPTKVQSQDGTTQIDDVFSGLGQQTTIAKDGTVTSHQTNGVSSVTDKSGGSASGASGANSR